MAFLSSMNITGSSLTAQQLRLDVISENVANMEAENGRDSFRNVLAQAAGGVPAAAGGLSQQGGVRVTQIIEDTSPFKLSYDPTHPDANAQGYVELPNIDLVKEISDAMAATQAFSANVTAFNTLKTVASRALEIGK